MTHRRTLAMAVGLMSVLAAGAASAQSPAGIAADPNAEQNRVPAPGLGNPGDPAAASDPAARVPTAPYSSSTGASSGEEGTVVTPGVTSPAGIPADPTTNENVQPGPGVANPTDPAAGSDPAARVPTSPPGTDSSAP